MKIIIEQKPEFFEDMLEEETANYSLNATYGIPEGATATEAASIFFRVMITKGYYPRSIINAFTNVAEYESDRLKSMNECYCNHCDDAEDY